MKGHAYGKFAFDRPREELNHHLRFENIGLIVTRQATQAFSVFATVLPVGQHKLATPYDGSYVAPVYLYPMANSLMTTCSCANRQNRNAPA